MTVQELNARLDEKNLRTSTWDRYTLRLEYGVGNQGIRGTGSKTHLVSFQIVTAEAGEHKPGTLRVGQAAEARARCNGNGQRTSMRRYSDETAITCQRCLESMK